MANVSYFGDHEHDKRVYLEICKGLERVKHMDIDSLLTEDKINLDDAVEGVDIAIEECENAKRLFYSWIFEGKVPDDMYEDEEEENDEEEPEDETPSEE